MRSTLWDCSTPAPSGGRKTYPPALLLPAAEVLPGWPPAGYGPSGGAELEKLAVKYAKKENGEKIAQTLRGDAERFRSGAEVSGLDRYLSLIYPDAAGGADYLPPDAVVFLCEGGRVEQRVKTVLLQLHQDTEALMEAGLMGGDAAEVCLSGEALFARLADFPVVMLDALPTSRHPLSPTACWPSTPGSSAPTAAVWRPPSRTWSTTGTPAVLCWCSAAVRSGRRTCCGSWRSGESLLCWI